MDNVIKVAVELGKAIQKDDRFIAFMLAQQAHEEDTDLQDKMKIFEEKREAITREVQKEDKDPELLKSLDGEVKELYNYIITNEKYIALATLQEPLQQMLNSINQIINGSASGLDPESIDYTASCSPSGCSGCSGC